MLKIVVKIVIFVSSISKKDLRARLSIWKYKLTLLVGNLLKNLVYKILVHVTDAFLNRQGPCKIRSNYLVNKYAIKPF